MNSPKHNPYDPQHLFQAKQTNVDYTFGFGTDNPADLNLASHDFLVQGYWMNLETLLTAPRPGLLASPQVQTLHHASKLVKRLWITWDTQANEITGTWVADHEPP